MAHKVFSKELVPSCTARDSVRISPLDIRIDEDPNLNGRAVLPDIKWLEDDFLNPAVGQIEPVLVRKKDGYPVLVAGRGRWRAAREITLAKNGPHENGSFMLK